MKQRLIRHYSPRSNQSGFFNQLVLVFSSWSFYITAKAPIGERDTEPPNPEENPVEGIRIHDFTIETLVFCKKTSPGPETGSDLNNQNRSSCGSLNPGKNNRFASVEVQTVSDTIGLFPLKVLVPAPHFSGHFVGLDVGPVLQPVS
ncbi:hypothetical protein CHARACLAT_016871 [Characodon lateralis]|uniref:Uncharacterized protein n=1 Tax=Characodon lateralis TaxID=208331 RepID=A0ABU7EA74_9TELE|nr:hypothetical protein [Characodon lateralis]